MVITDGIGDGILTDITGKNEVRIINLTGNKKTARRKKTGMQPKKRLGFSWS